MTATLVENLEQIMRERGLNPSQLALMAGLNHTGVRDILSGKSRSATLATTVKLAEALKIPARRLLEKEAVTTLRSEMEYIFEKLPEPEQKRLLQTGRAWLSSPEPT